MKKTYLFVIVIFCYFNSYAQVYNMTAGTINTCGGTFYDAGGSGAQYTNNSNITETFCSNAGNCLRVTFTAFNTQAGNDFLTIYDGPNNTFPTLGTFSGNGLPGTFTSSTGCLTFNFTSDNAGIRNGWAATISCVACVTTVNMSTGTSNLCGANFYDSGSSGANYSNNENFTRTFCSSVAGQCIQVDFTTFNTQAGNDVLTAYDGPTTASPLIAAYSGTVIPPTLIASSGCITFTFVTNNATVRPGWSAIVSCTPCPTPPAAVPNYIHPTTGLQNTYVGANMVNTCGATYMDNGGTANYSNNINSIYRTFCPNQAGKCIRATFWNFDVEGPFLGIPVDYLTILNGPTQGSPEFGGAGGSTWYGTAATYQACMGAGLGPYVSTDPSGCLSFRFTSDGSVNRAGWTITLDCIPCPYGPNGTDNSDCRNNISLCSDLPFSDASTGPGIVSDAGTGCAIAENYTNWYQFIVSSSGTIGLNLTPNVAADDYDFAIYGPLGSNACGSLGTPVRCSYAANTGNTGLNSATNLVTNTAVCGTPNNGSDVSEDVCGNGWVNDLPVIAGQRYYVCVNNWSPGGNGFTLDWTFAGGASFNCLILPVEFLTFTAAPAKETVQLNWATASEHNNDYFTIERSDDGKRFFELNRVKGKGNSAIESNYNSVDDAPMQGLNYYRIKQTDYDGLSTYSRVIAINTDEKSDVMYLVPNPAHANATVNYHISAAANLLVYDAKGMMVAKYSLSASEGMNEFDLDLSAFEKGFYNVVLESEKQLINKKLVVY